MRTIVQESGKRSDRMSFTTYVGLVRRPIANLSDDLTTGLDRPVDRLSLLSLLNPSGMAFQGEANVSDSFSNIPEPPTKKSRTILP